ncbi:bifunctional diaminohydroxyphosphoribosylaminopyrimidine deaminase/5-amino-6-(5-phosphoribosylamino)uracil reductase RibD [Maribacter sp. 2210JD10-5]|uniref:bifunctional diaminohydroxyphosphoribosylaminopyrimidine deaminase/5-amino-6-(5-phosphoribosylamino)uracil reductase RibD n=1 Tax=Maribacter sp. 2210JD10-5 TaxID=3386272 RepID=UPI0039BD3EA6
MSTAFEQHTTVFELDKQYMKRCIQIAKKGLGHTAPNPMVGSVIVQDGNIIGEGFTSPYGGAHAEVNAINAVEDKSLLKKATLYVTLEPCSHFGKTPPCADLIVKHQIKTVVIGVLDPNPMVSGKGIEKLRANGCEVRTGILETECRAHHKRFLTFQEQKRPYIILKWAETVDGFIAPLPDQRNQNLEPYWITNAYSRQLVHKWRSEEQAILVGTTTVLADNPKLDVRDWTGKHPFRVILDKSLKIDMNYHVLDKSINTLILTEIQDAHQDIKGINYEVLDFSKPLAVQIMNTLWEYNFTSVFIEGGRQTLQTFINEGLWDEARIFKGPITFKNGIKAPEIMGTPIHSRMIQNDQLTILQHD